MPIHPIDDVGSLEQARKRLYDPKANFQDVHTPFSAPKDNFMPHSWNEPPRSVRHDGKRQVHIAGIFFIVAFVFFIISVGVAAYFFYFGGNSISVNNIDIKFQGPTTIAGGDTVPLTFTVTNKNSVAIDNATIEIDFPNSTRSIDDMTNSYPRYVENVGTIPGGGSVTRSMKVVLFGGAGTSITLPVSFSYGTSGSSSTFVKKSSYAISVSSTPLSVSVSTLSEAVSGTPFSTTLTVRSNATVPINNVVLSNVFPFGFSVISSSLPLNNSSFLIGTLAPGEGRSITIVGTLSGQEREQRAFHFTVGTAKTSNDQVMAVTYMTQDVDISISAPFISTTLSLNGNTSQQNVISPKSYQSVNLSYKNTLSTSVENTIISISISGSAIDYDSIRTTSGFYSSSDHTIVFSKDTDPSLASLAPGASGVGSFTFSTLSPEKLPVSPNIIFTVSVSGTRTGQTNVPEQINTSTTKTIKVLTTVLLSSESLHNSGPFKNVGPIPPQEGQTTYYTILWNVQNVGSAIAGGTVSTVLPNYVSYTDVTAGAGSFSYDSGSRKVTWNIGNMAQNGNAQGAFQISFVPSTSQKKTVPTLTGTATFSGYDRYAGMQVSATANAVTTETIRDAGYISANASVQ